jgi:hypothetical protein
MNITKGTSASPLIRPLGTFSHRERVLRFDVLHDVEGVVNPLAELPKPRGGRSHGSSTQRSRCTDKPPRSIALSLRERVVRGCCYRHAEAKVWRWLQGLTDPSDVTTPLDRYAGTMIREVEGDVMLPTSPSPRSSSAVIGLGGSTPSSVRFSGDMVTKCIFALRRVAPVLSFRPDSSAPVPIAAKENVTFDPSPCPLPEGEGSPPLARESSKFIGCNIQTPDLLPQGEGSHDTSPFPPGEGGAKRRVRGRDLCSDPRRSATNYHQPHQQLFSSRSRTTSI